MHPGEQIRKLTVFLKPLVIAAARPADVYADPSDGYTDPADGYTEPAE
jgi:hypothetical protein